MKVKFNVTSRELNKILKKENEEILGKIILGKNDQKRRKIIERIVSIALVLMGALFLESSYGFFNEETMILLKWGFALIIVGAILTIFFGNKFSLNYLAKERMKFIRERNKDILLATDNYEKEEFSIDAELEIQDEFIEIDFGKIKKVYGIDSIESVQVEDIFIILEFKTKKYFIKKNSFKSKEDIKKLSELVKEKREKREYEIKEKIVEEIDLKEYDITPIKELNIKNFIKNILKLQRKEVIFLKYLSIYGAIMMILSSGMIDDQLAKSGLFIIVTFIVLLNLGKSNGGGLFIHKIKEKNKFYSNIGFKKVRMYLGEKYNYIFIGDDITIVEKNNMVVKREHERVVVELFKKPFFEATKKEKENKIILDIQKNIDRKEQMKLVDNELKNKLKDAYTNKKIFIFIGIWSVLIILLGIEGMKKLEGIVFIVIGYIVFYINGERLRKNVDKLMLKVIEDRNIDKDNERKIKIKIYRDKAIIEEKYLRRIYPISEVSIREEDISFEDELRLPINIFSEDEIKIIEDLSKENKEKLKKDKEVIIQGKKSIKDEEVLKKGYKKLVVGLFNSGFIGTVIAIIGVGIAVNKIIAIGFLLGIALIYFTVMKTLKNDVMEHITSNSGMYICKNKLYVENKESLEEYDLDILDIEYDEKKIILKREDENLVFIEPTEEALVWFKINKKIK